LGSLANQKEALTIVFQSLLISSLAALGISVELSAKNNLLF
jgi:hypothetical protein